MSWHPNDLVSDLDLLDYEAGILTDFGQDTWHGKRQKALEDWLFPILKSRGFDPYRLRTRANPTQAFSYTSAAYTDQTAAVSDTTEDDLNLAAVLATPGSDALYLGSDKPFRGLFVRMADTVSTAAGVLSVAYWNGNWEPVLVTDGTIQTSGKTLSASGSVSWLLPHDWIVRVVNGSDRLYWAKVTVSAVPTSARAGQMAVILGSALRGAVTFRTLQLIMAEARTSSEGPWPEKADFYKDEADLALQRALPIIGGEFDTDESDQLSDDEQGQTAEEAGGGPWVMERA